MTVANLFAGAGGWDIAARQLGHDPIGLEVDDAVCATRAAAGLRTIQVDLRQHIGRPAVVVRADRAPLFGDWPTLDLRRRDLDGLIASPPCPAFSIAGTGRGRAELADLIEAMERHDRPSSTASTDAQLLWLPFDWIVQHRPSWVAIEQVPPVLPFFEAMADRLPYLGYFTWTGVLNAADYGAPQTRRRAILLARIIDRIEPPAPTHAGRWTSMADALGLGGELLGLTDGWELNPGTYAQNGGNRRRYKLSEPAPTIAFGNDMACWYWEKGDERKPLTPGQAARLQGFPWTWPFAGNAHDVAQQIGNAVPVDLARAVLAQVARP